MQNLNFTKNLKVCKLLKSFRKSKVKHTKDLFILLNTGFERYTTGDGTDAEAALGSCVHSLVYLRVEWGFQLSVVIEYYWTKPNNKLQNSLITPRKSTQSQLLLALLC